jgi:hypothetical protein
MNEPPEGWPFREYLLIPLFALVALSGLIAYLDQVGVFGN